MSYDVGWYYGNATFEDSLYDDLYLSSSYASFIEGSSSFFDPTNRAFYGSVTGLLGGETIVWDSVWTPVFFDEAPDVSFPPLGEEIGLVRVGPILTSGVLKLLATVNGVAISPYLVITFGEHDAYYGAVAWTHVIPVGGGGGVGMPEITKPLGIPTFLEAGHAITPRSVYANVEMVTGYARKRRVYTTAPRIQAVSLVLNAVQMAMFDRWFEETLLVGTRRFAAHIASDHSSGLVWWNAQWVAPYRAQPLSSTQWRVTGELLLIGTGSVTGPVSTSAQLEVFAPLLGTAAATISGDVSMEVEAALLSVSLAAIEITAALLTILPSFVLREDSGYVLREDGGRIQREEA